MIWATMSKCHDATTTQFHVKYKCDEYCYFYWDHDRIILSFPIISELDHFKIEAGLIWTDMGMEFAAYLAQNTSQTLQWCHNGRYRSQITSRTIVYSIVYSGGDQRKYQSFAWLAFVRGIHRWPVNSPHKWHWVINMLCSINDCIASSLWCV